jgi:uncharacterized membrane protein YfcA
MLLVLAAAAVSFTLSASAGLGGSLILVPTLALVLGTKEGVALAALLLAANNIVKVLAYRETLPVRKALVVIVLVAVGAALGARLLVAAPEAIVTLAVIVSFVFALIAERLDLSRLRRLGGPVLAFGSGATSGFSGTSGPLKGMAIRQLDLDRAHFVGAASLVSLVGDVTKAAVFNGADLLEGQSFLIALVAVPLMVIATFTGRTINRSIGERGYTWLFWGVMAGYTVRLILSL